MAEYRRKKQLAPVVGAVSGLVRDRGWERKVEQHRIFVEWEGLVDEEIVAHARPLKIVKEVLWLEVENSAWMQQLQFRKHFLLEQLNGRLKRSRLRDLRFALAATEQPGEKRKTGQEATPLRFVSVEPELVERFRQQIDCVGDEQTREALFRFWYLSQACRKS